MGRLNKLCKVKKRDWTSFAGDRFQTTSGDCFWKASRRVEGKRLFDLDEPR